jgi:hypothetical protein
MRELNTDGTMKDVSSLLHEQGFHVGDHVHRKAGNIRGQIEEISADEVKVKLEDPPGVIAKFPLVSFLQNQWLQYKPKVHAADVALTVVPSTCPQFSSCAAASAIHHAVSELTFQHESILQYLKIQLKPKAVVVTKSFEKGKLILVPTCLKVSYSVDRPARQVIDILVPGSKTFFWLTPMTGLPKTDEGCHIVPFWHVQGVDEHHNMELVWLKVGDAPFKVPVLKNNKQVKPGDALVRRSIGADTPTQATADADPPPQKKRKSN